jgi:alanyl-tRNA synthetase
MVAPERLRFDFSHPKPIGEEEMEKVEALANRVILQDAPVDTKLMDRESAIHSGAMALFGEKYGDEVRVVSMGADPDGGARKYSVELCGGTHVGRTGEIGLVTVLSEGGVAAGVRRVEALTGEAARRHLEAQEKHLQAIASTLRVRPEEAAERVAALVEERKRLERDLAEAKKKLALGGGGAAAAGNGVREVGPFRFLGRTLNGINPRDLKGIADDGKASVGSGVVAIIGVGDDGKAGLVVGVTPDLTARLSAVDLVRVGSEALGGRGGGGRPDLAQAGGPDGSKAAEALAAIEAAIRARA